MRPRAEGALTESSRGIFRDPADRQVLMLDGYGLSATVSRGHLVLRDGIGRHRRERRLSRAQRTVTRIVILGHTGHVSLEAVRWCRNVGVSIVQLDHDGTLQLTAGFDLGRDDPRLRRSQAAAAGTVTGLEVSRRLIT